LEQLLVAVDRHARTHPLDPGLPDEAARRALGLAGLGELRELVVQAQLVGEGGRIRRAATMPSLGPKEADLAALEARLTTSPFRAPEQGELALDHRELAVAVTLGRLMVLPDQIYLLPTAPALAMRQLATLDQPFTTSQARQELDTTRRVIIPLLEHLDDRGWTERIDAGHRRVKR
jgi:selenocysteine-specific elongation factor